MEIVNQVDHVAQVISEEKEVKLTISYDKPKDTSNEHQNLDMNPQQNEGQVEIHDDNDTKMVGVENPIKEEKVEEIRIEIEVGPEPVLVKVDPEPILDKVESVLIKAELEPVLDKVEPALVKTELEPEPVNVEPEPVAEKDTLKSNKEEEKLEPTLKKTDTNKSIKSRKKEEGDSESDEDSDSNENPDEGPLYRLTDKVNLIDPPSEAKQLNRSKSILILETKKQEGPQIKMI
jgi:anti-sigma28 factor (negative regulator of flagellin synthesis)